MILEYENYISSNFVEEIQQNLLPFVKNSTTQVAQNRDGITVNVSNTPELCGLDSKLNVMFSTFQQNVLQHRFKPRFNSGDTGYEYHLYRPGEICRYHTDGELTSNSLLRYATVILFLTDNQDGEIVFPDQGIEIKPKKGKIIAFPPYGMFGHYTKPTVENREILMTWFVYNGLTVQQNAT